MNRMSCFLCCTCILLDSEREHTSLFCFAVFSERIVEDSESLVECMMTWATVSSNKILFVERADKYDLFRRPEVLLGPFNSLNTKVRIRIA